MTTELRPAEESITEFDSPSILQELNDCWGKFPEAALRYCQQHREIAIPHFIRAIEKATETARAGNKVEGDTHWIGLYFLWEFRAKEALPCIMAALSLPERGCSKIA